MMRALAIAMAITVITIPLTNSVYLDPVPELGNPELTLNDTSYVTFDAMLDDLRDNFPTVRRVAFEFGDYTGWGLFRPGAGAFDPIIGTAVDRYVFECVDQTMPWKRVGQTLFYQCDIWDSSYVVLSGITFGSGSPLDGTVFFRPGTSNIVAHQLYFKEDPGYCVRMLGRDCTLQRMLAVDHSTSGDQPCVQIETNNVGYDCFNNRILDCEIRNWNDGIVITAAFDGMTELDNPVDGTIIDGNECYVDSKKRLHENGGEYSDAENGFDFKTGTDDVDNPILFINNRVWGYRYTAPSLAGGGKSANGAAVTNHVWSRNILATGNIFDNCSIGWFENNWKAGYGSGTRNTKLRGNHFANIQQFSPSDATGGGAIYSPHMPLDIDGDTFSSVWRLGVANSGVNGAHAFANLKKHNVPLDGLAGEWAASASNTDELVIIHYQRKRFSGA